MKARMNRNTATSLTVQAKMWPTPIASAGTRGSDPPHGDGAPSLKTLVTHSHHAPTTQPAGPNGPPKVDLNPAFVAALMGLPPDWLMHFTSAATDSSHKPPPKPGANSPHDCEPTR